MAVEECWVEPTMGYEPLHVHVFGDASQPLTTQHALDLRDAGACTSWSELDTETSSPSEQNTGAIQ